MQEKFYWASGEKKLDINLQSKYNLSRPTQITQQAALISVHEPSRFLCYFLLKNCRNNSLYQSSISAQHALDFCAKTVTKLYCTDCIKCSRTALENCVQNSACTLGNVPDFFLEIYAWFFWKNVPKLSWKTVLKPYCTAAINEVVLHLDFYAQ